MVPARASFRMGLILGLSMAAVASAEPPPKPASVSPLVSGLMAAEPFSVPAADLLQAAASVPVHPFYSVAELVEDQHVVYDQAGRATATYRYLFRVDREGAVKGWGLVSAGWTPWLEERPEIRARVITADGVEHRLDPSTLSDAPAGGSSQDLFEDRRLLRGPLPSLQVGSLAEVEIRTVSHRALSRCGVRRNFLLTWNVPVQRARLRIELPENAPLKWILDALPAKALQRRKAGGVLSLSVDQELCMPMKAREPYEAFDEEPWPNLTLATAPSWSAVASEYLELVDAQLQGADVKAWVAQAIGGTPDRALRIQRILARLQQTVRYVGLEFGAASIVPRTPAETLRRGYGDCKDKAVLLVALLREAGIGAHVALLRAGLGRDFSSDLPGLEAFNHAIVAVEGAEVLWIDPSVPQAPAGTLPIQDCGRKALVIRPGTVAPVAIPDVEPGRNLQITTREVFLAENGSGRLEETHEAVGAAEINFRGNFTGAEPARLRENLKGYVKTTFSSERLGRVEHPDPLDLTRPFKLFLEAQEAGRAHTSEAEARVVMNPWPLVTDLNQILQPGEKDPAAEAPAGTEPRRRTDLLIPHPWTAEMRWLVHVPKGFAPGELPAAAAVDFGPAQLTLDWKVRADGDVEAAFRFRCHRLRWTPAEVDAARAALKTYEAEPSPVLVLQHTGQAHLLAGRLPEALREFRALAAAEPGSAAPLVRLAKAQLLCGLGGPARETLARAIALDPKSEPAHRQLGWTLQHDAVGRRFSPGWDRAGAIRALRTAMALAPGERMARLDLAVVLSVGARGEWLGSGDLEEAATLYQDQLSRGKDDKAQTNLTRCLASLGRFEQARASAQAMAPSEARNGWIAALDACLKGPEAAIKEVRRVHPDGEARRKAIRNASDTLIDLRRYPEAGALARELASAGTDAEDMRKRALQCESLKRYETVPVDRSTPAGAVLAFAKAAVDQDLPPERFFETVSPAQRPVRMDPAAVRETSKTFLYLSPLEDGWRKQRLDEAFSLETLGQEGSETTGFRLTTRRSSPFPTTIYVARHAGVYRIVGWDSCLGNMGREALWDLAHGNLESARAWLDRALAEARPAEPGDPFKGHLLHGLWTRGRKGDAAAIRLAAVALCAVNGPEEASGPHLKTLEEALSRTGDPASRVALLRALVHNPADAEGRAKLDARLAELLALSPGQGGAALAQVHALMEADRGMEALAVLRKAQADYPAYGAFDGLEPAVLGALGRFKEAIEARKVLIARGKATANQYNELAWQEVCRGAVSEETARTAEECVKLEKSPAHLHTQATALEELGRVEAARTALLASLRGEEPPTPASWYTFARIAEKLGEAEVARSFYAKAMDPARSGEGRPGSCTSLARRRLAEMDGGKPFAIPD